MNMTDRQIRMTRSFAGALLGGALMAGLAVFGFQQFAQAKDPGQEKDTPREKPALRLHVDDTPLARDGRMATSFADTVKKVTPSVVKVYTTVNGKPVTEMGSPFPDDPMLRRFFGERFGNGQGFRRGMTPKQQGAGSGVIVTKDGYILTNNHVVDGADEVKVQVGEDSEEFTAKVVGKDPKTDIAVIKIESSSRSFDAVTTADSDKIQVGDVVLAVGNPFGIGQTVTMGIVSATGRATLGMEYEDFIQTDAAINPGNSGGALVDAHGRLIGINTAIISRTGGNQGIGFAVPINLARSVMENLIEHGRVIRGFMGVNIQDVTPALAKEFDLKDAEGALVADITPNSPAEKAGLESGDVILEFNGKPVRDSRSLKLQVAQITPGTEVGLKISRGGKVKELEVTLKEFPSDRLAGRSASPGESSKADLLDGVTVDDLTPEARRQFEIPAGVRGAVVVEVDPNSPPAEAGLRPGDVIQEIDRQPVKNAEEAVAMSDLKGAKSVLLRVWSRGGSRFVIVKDQKLG